MTLVAFVVKLVRNLQTMQVVESFMVMVLSVVQARAANVTVQSVVYCHQPHGSKLDGCCR